MTVSPAAPAETLAAQPARTRYGLLLGWAVAAACVATLLLVARPLGLLTSLLTHTAFAAPGVLMVRAAMSGRHAWLPTAAFGPLLGMALSSVAVLGLWEAGGRGPWILLVGPALLCPLAWLTGRLHGRWSTIEIETADIVCLGLLLALVPLLVARPFALVGAAVPEGEVYRAYFTADYVWRRTVVAELAKGAALPLNPFFLHDYLHYYWLPHLLTAVEYRWLHDRLDINELLLVNAVLIDLAFVTFLYGVGRLFVARPAAVAAGVACSILFTSFEGLYGLWDHWRIGASLSLMRNMNVDALSRWLLHAMPVDGLQRLLWYQPHHALGYATGLLGLLTITRRARAVDATVFVIGGVLLAISTLISSFGGLMLTTAAALHEAVAVAHARAWGRAAWHFVAAAVPLALGAATIFALRYVDTGGQIITVGLNKVAVHNVLPGTFVSFGPMLFLAGPGLWLAWRHHRATFGALFALLIVCVAFYFFVDIRDHQNVYVGWRVGHLTFIACGALTALTFDRLLALPMLRQRLAWAAVIVVLACSAPTFAIDAYNTQDIANRGQASGFRWTLVLTHDELEAFNWIRVHTGPDAVFQVDPVVRDAETWAYLPAFAERRMSAGLPISMVPLDKYVYESSRIRRIYDEEVGEAYDRARRNGVQFVFVGPPERTAHPGVESRFDSMPDLLPVVFRNGTISIYRVNGT